MHPLTSLWNLRQWMRPNGPVDAARRLHRKAVALETLESREVPATVLVTTLEDGTNPTSPLPGSLRWALMTQQSDPLTSQGTTIEFDENLFKDSAGNWVERTLTLNGAAGALVPNQLLATVDGTPDSYDRYIEGEGLTAAWKPLLTIQADIGLANVQVEPWTIKSDPVTSLPYIDAPGGRDFELGDIIEQGTGTYISTAGVVFNNCGGARFLVTGVEIVNNPLKPNFNPLLPSFKTITALAVINPGSNAFLGKDQNLGKSTIQLSYNSTLQPTQLKTISGKGSGLVLKDFTTSNISYASSIFYTQLIEPPIGQASRQTLTLEDIRFGDNKGSTILQNTGNLVVNQCVFDGNIYNPKLTDFEGNTKVNADVRTLNLNPEPFISTAVGETENGNSYGGGLLTITQTQFSNNNTQINYKGTGPLNIETCLFYKDPLVTEESPIVGGGINLTSVTNPLLNSGRAVEAIMSQAGSSALIINNSQFYLNNWTDSANSNKYANAGVYCNAVNQSIYNSFFSNLSGGALVIDQAETPNATASVSTSVFQNNRGVRSDSFPLNYRANPPVNNFNTVTPLAAGLNPVAYGGPLFTFGQSGAVSIDNSIFTNNSLNDTLAINTPDISSGGGAIYNYNCTLSIDNSSFTGNSIRITGSTPIPGVEMGGGALFSGGGTSIRGSLFTNNGLTSEIDCWDSKASVDQLRFIGGGAAYLTSSPIFLDGTPEFHPQLNHRLENTTIQGNLVTFKQQASSSATGTGLNGGGLLIANASKATDDVQAPIGNIIANCTIVQNKLVNDQATFLNAARFLTSNGSRVVTETGGIFNNMWSGNTFVLNTILLQNTGNVFLPATNFNPVNTLTNTGSKPLDLRNNSVLANGTGDFSYGKWNSDGYSGYNLYNNAYSYYQPAFATRYHYANPWLSFGQVIDPETEVITNNRADGDLISGSQTGTSQAPVFDTRGLSDNLAIVVGLQTPANYPAQWGTYPSISAKLLTMALDRNSPARDGGYSQLYTNNPGPIPTDARGVDRFINEAVDIGAYEVQTGTDSSFNNLTYSPQIAPDGIVLSSSQEVKIQMPANLTILKGQPVVLHPLIVDRTTPTNIPDTSVAQNGVVSAYNVSTGLLTITKTGYFTNKPILSYPNNHRWSVTIVDTPLVLKPSTSATPSLGITYGRGETVYAEVQQNDIITNKDPVTNIPIPVGGFVDLVGIEDGVVYGKGEIGNLLDTNPASAYATKLPGTIPSPVSSRTLARTPLTWPNVDSTASTVWLPGLSGTQTISLPMSSTTVLLPGQTILLSPGTTNNAGDPLQPRVQQYGKVLAFNAVTKQLTFEKTAFTGATTAKANWVLRSIMTDNAWTLASSGTQKVFLIGSPSTRPEPGQLIQLSPVSPTGTVETGITQFGTVISYNSNSGLLQFDKVSFINNSGASAPTTEYWELTSYSKKTNTKLPDLAIPSENQFEFTLPESMTAPPKGSFINLSPVENGEVLTNIFQVGKVTNDFDPKTRILQITITAKGGQSANTYYEWQITSFSQSLTATGGTNLASSGIAKFVLSDLAKAEYQAGWKLLISPVSDSGQILDSVQYGTILSYNSSTKEIELLREASQGNTVQKYNRWMITAIPNISEVTINDPTITGLPYLPGGTHPYKWVYNSDSEYAYSQSGNFYISTAAVGMDVVINGPGVPNPSTPGTPVQFEGDLKITATTRATPNGILYLKGQDSSGNTLNLANLPIDASTPFSGGVYHYTFTYSFPSPTFTPGSYPVWVEFDSSNDLEFSSDTSASVTQELGNTLIGVDLIPFSPSPYGRTELVTFTAKVQFNRTDGVPNGNLVFRSQNNPIIVGTLNAPEMVTYAGTVGTATYTLTTSPIMLPAGTTAIVADYQRTATGTQYLSMTSAPKNLTIQSTATSVTLSGGPVSSTYGTQIDLTAIVGPSGGLPYNSSSPGTVQFYANGTPFGAPVPLTLNQFGWPNPVTTRVSDLGASTSPISITAIYSGDITTFSQSQSNSLSVTVDRASTSLSLSFDPAGTSLPTQYPIQMFAQMSQTAPAPAPVGSTVNFYDVTSGTPVLIGTGTLDANGMAELSTPYQFATAGNYVINASFSGNSNYTSSAQSVVVNAYNRVQPVATLSISPPGPVTGYGVPITLSVVLNPTGGPSYSTGQVIFRNGKTELGRVTPDADGIALFTPSTDLPPGGYQFNAEYTGDMTQYMGALSATIDKTIDKGLTSLTLTSNPSTVQVGQPVTLTATLATPGATPDVSPTGMVEFYLAGRLIGTSALVAGQATLLNFKTTSAGTLQFEARYTGNTLFKQSAGTVNVVVSRDAIERFYLVAPQQGNAIQVFDRATNRQLSEFMPNTPSYTGGYTVAKGDVNGDGVSDMLYAANTGGQITVLDGRNYTPLGVVNPFGTNFPAPLSISVGDINGDGYGDILAAPGGHGLPPHVVVMSGKDFNQPLFSQYAYAPQFLGGVSVAAGDTNGDGFQDVITAPLRGAPPHIVSFSGRDGRVLQSYYAYAPQYLGGVSITAKDMNDDGYAEIITAATSAAPHVVIVDSKLVMENPNDSSRFVVFSQYVYSPTFGGGVRVSTVADLNGDGVEDILTVPGPGAGPNLVRIDGLMALKNKLQVLDSFFAYGTTDPNANFLGGTFVG